MRHFKKDSANLAIAWEQYRSEQHHRYSNAALRMQHGLKIEAEEQQQLLAHSRAITEALPDEINPIAVGQSEAVGFGGAAMPAPPPKVVAFPSREAVAEKAAPVSQDERDQEQSLTFPSSTSSVINQHSALSSSQSSLMTDDWSLMTEKPAIPTDSDGFAENPDAYRIWQPKPVEGEPLQAGQLQEKLAALT